MQHVPMYAAHLFDAVVLYATALGDMLRQNQLTEPADIIEAAKDGRSLFKRIIQNRKYDSKSSLLLKIKFSPPKNKNQKRWRRWYIGL